jgi:hypothetical protein
VLWLPVPPAKRDKAGLQAVLPRALAFVSAHLAAGRRVLIQDDEGEGSARMRADFFVFFLLVPT